MASSNTTNAKEYKFSTYFKNTHFIDLPNKSEETNAHIIINDTQEDVPIVISMNAGSGDVNLDSKYVGVNNGNHLWQQQEWKTIGGRYGKTINLSIDSKLILTAHGGSGNLAGIVTKRQKRTRHVWKDGSDNDNLAHWNKWYDDYINNAINIKREGQQEFKILMFHSGSKLKIEFLDNGARNVYKGNVSIAWADKNIVFDNHIIKA